MSAFAVFGNPIKHSKSAEIYSLFAKEIGISSKYDLRLVSKIEDFDIVVRNFFDTGGLGANFTVPFKERAFFLCNQLTDRALMANAVNTIKKRSDNSLLGDNTDGIGLMNDLKRLCWLDFDDSIIEMNENKNLSSRKSDTHILLIGAGGAARGIIPMLLNIKGCYINVVNRTLLNAQKLVYYYHSIGCQNISYIDINKLKFHHGYNIKKYDLIINASSSSMSHVIPMIPSFLVSCFTKCYDVFYQNQDTVFITWCKKHGSNYCSDGLGMLVEQAAYAFYLWHNIFPSVKSVIDFLKSKNYV
ncbi:shikimate 5-dehydrogenase [Candidatus Blochmanniella vafra str. BVAF]|uniref:Shikimate dehydrogenase (NADP(+)) n=1 Tax=Blochmanniella vafra (strain BVAF) TaxID=859654 RepID=E8Q607_BLOVB|nr:shikimate dehydrogenase [Candidatus Blochmannia vafer]ADV33623.1 shikimate 5-dehydrogenase [Candidatus Blochmannia vafer str. BVAF]